MTTPLRLGVIGSSGGSALTAATECLAAAGKVNEWVVVTDRPCGMETWAQASGHRVQRLAYQDAESFSRQAYEIFSDAACTDVLLFYTRRVAAPLIDRLRVWNIHPALLPAFKGLHGVADAVGAGARLLGATLHRVDAGLDTGPIVAQVAAPLSSQSTLAAAERLSYQQKVWLVLSWIDQLTAGEKSTGADQCVPAVWIASPGLVDSSLVGAYRNWLAMQPTAEVTAK